MNAIPEKTETQYKATALPLHKCAYFKGAIPKADSLYIFYSFLRLVD
jgi:hypothetical protein